ncbi:MAG: hypothetical protein QNK77_08280, partial [Crocinitomicaceae bacterium]
MNKLKTIIVAMLFAAPVFSQVEEEAQEGEVIITEGQITIIEEGEGEPDTTKMKVGNKEIIIITHPNEDFDLDSEDDSEDESPKRKRKSDAHWAGVDLGFT